MIIYFTGTGNSRFLANRLGKVLDDKVINSIDYIKNQEYPKFQSEKPYVFVAPTYAWRIPRLFEEWICKCEFSGNHKVYFVLNCGSSIGAAAKYIKRLCLSKKMEYMGTEGFVMPENYIAMFSAPDDKEEKELIINAERKIVPLAESIKVESKLKDIGVGPIGHLCSGIINKLFYKYTMHDKKFYATDKCISCGKCAENCMLRNIELKNGKPVWNGMCTHCMACICKCPTEAIEYGRHTVGLKRYVCKEEAWIKMLLDMSFETAVLKRTGKREEL